MEAKNYLGIYLSKDTATVVCLSPQGRGHKVVGCFSVSAEEQAEQKHHQLATLITQGCTERDLQFSEVAVALDCAMFMQHNVHSEFKDIKQITQTVRFDAEEALATDIGDIAISFKINSSDNSGSDLSVFTAERKVLSDVILSLQSNHMDPVSVEPDVSCLSRFIYRNMSLPEDSRPVFSALSRRSGYFIVPNPPGSKDTGLMRTFLVGPTRMRTEQLAREVYVTTALLENEKPVNCLRVFDSSGSVNYEQLSGRLGFEASGIDLVEAAATEPQTLADCSDTVDFAIAYGAALARLGQPQCINFRSDFMPFQGKKLRMEKALKFASVSVTVLLLALGMYFQMPLLKMNDYRDQLRKKFSKDFSAVMPGKGLPAKFSIAKRNLSSELGRIKDVQSGRFGAEGEKSMLSKLTLVLEAFNKCASSTKLNINKVSVTTKSIRIGGDTSSRSNTHKLFAAVRDKMEIEQFNYDLKGGRDNFNITVVPK
ncbi:MAG: hypothetical protein BBJ57_00795 [Desulfobacterales bacterium PC51MH44]|nr:MAG: hypothetical protein BBJ57_00795 [Desulfobacterales bacterium PC51MH44]